jgi:hypothetical protein
MSVGYIQIYQESYVCKTVSDVRIIRIQVTGEQRYLKKSGIDDNGCSWMISQRKYINVIGTFNVPINIIKNIFVHAKDIILDAYIKNGTITIFGDNGQLYSGFLSENIPDLTQTEIILQGSKPWLSANNLEYF